MKTIELEYELPQKLIAQDPPKIRGRSRLLVLDRVTGNMQHRSYADIPSFLNKKDIAVLNRTKVMKARVYFSVKRSGKKVEVLFLRKMDEKKGEEEIWECLIGRARNVKIGDVLVSPKNEEIIVQERIANDPRFLVSGSDIRLIMSHSGKIPLPPYIKRTASISDERRYNTVFAKSLRSAASPTASLNLTSPILKKIRTSCAAVCYVELDIGLGTFRPIDTEDIESYRIHKEHVRISSETAEKINECQGRVWAFGTTVVRALETAAVGRHHMEFFEGETKLFIYPGYKFKIVDALVTNFHMPRTSLLSLVYAFAGKENIRKAYVEAIREEYRFLSYGDSMLILDMN